MKSDIIVTDQRYRDCDPVTAMSNLKLHGVVLKRIRYGQLIRPHCREAVAFLDNLCLISSTMILLWETQMHRLRRVLDVKLSKTKTIGERQCKVLWSGIGR